jgi:hypothetical protein
MGGAVGAKDYRYSNEPFETQGAHLGCSVIFVRHNGGPQSAVEKMHVRNGGTRRDADFIFLNSDRFQMRLE